MPFLGLLWFSKAVLGEFNHNFIVFPLDKKCRPRVAVINPLLLVKQSRDTLMSASSESLLAREDVQPHVQM